MGLFQGQHFLVFGATSEIGSAIVTTLINQGAKVTASGRSQAKLNRLEEFVKHNIKVIPCDLLQKSSRELFFRESINHFGKFNGIIYAAGFHKLLPFGLGYSKGLDEHILMNLVIPLDLVRNFISRAVSDSTDQRTITLISSIAHRFGEPALSAYSASKGGLVSAVRGLAIELASKNIRINTVSPGWIMGDSAVRVAKSISVEAESEISAKYPLGYGLPEDVANAVAYIASPLAKWVTGTDLVVDGGRSCV